jgi:hypothetical protein
MKVYTISYNDDYKSCNIDACYDYHVPFVSCHVCGNSWGCGYFAYPGFHLELRGKESIFNDDKFISLPEFKHLRNEILKCAGLDVWIAPGSGLGPLTGTAVTHRLDDFAWSGFHRPLIRRESAEALQSAGIEIKVTEPRITWRGKPVTTHYDLHIEPLSGFSYTPETASELTISYCHECGYVWQQNRKLKIQDEQIRLQLGKLPPDRTIMRLREFATIIVTEPFVQAVERLELTGIRFLDHGEFV